MVEWIRDEWISFISSAHHGRIFRGMETSVHLRGHGWITGSLKTRACIKNPPHHALYEFDQTSRNLSPSPNRGGGVTRPTTRPIGLKVKAAVASAEINVDLICPLRTPSFPLGTHEYNLTRHNLIEGVSKYNLQTRSPDQIQCVFWHSMTDYMMQSIQTDPR